MCHFLQYVVLEAANNTVIMTHATRERDAGIGQTGEIDGGARRSRPTRELVEGSWPMRACGVSLVRAWGARRNT